MRDKALVCIQTSTCMKYQIIDFNILLFDQVLFYYRFVGFQLVKPWVLQLQYAVTRPEL